jgi:hypothetical protein
LITPHPAYAGDLALAEIRQAQRLMRAHTKQMLITTTIRNIAAVVKIARKSAVTASDG